MRNWMWVLWHLIAIFYLKNGSIIPFTTSMSYAVIYRILVPFTTSISDASWQKKNICRLVFTLVLIVICLPTFICFWTLRKRTALWTFWLWDCIILHYVFCFWDFDISYGFHSAIAENSFFCLSKFDEIMFFYCFALSCSPLHFSSTVRLSLVI